MNQFIFPLRIYYEDTDLVGIVYHANYLKYFERARSEWAEQIGMGTEWQREKSIYFLVRSANIDFLKPASLHEQVEVVSCVAEVRKASLVYDQHLRLKARPDTIFCKATVKVACIDQNRKPQALPEVFLSQLDSEISESSA